MAETFNPYDGKTTYSDFFEVDEGFYPVITPATMQDPKTSWKTTYPHKDVVKLIKQVEQMLSRQSPMDWRSLWIDGAYGTGKSRIIWTLQSLLDCPAEDLNEYFDRYSNLRDENDLRQKLLVHKENKIVTAYRYGSGEIESTQQLINAVYESVSEGLRKAGIPYQNGHTIRETITSWLQDEANRVYFNAKLQQYPEFSNSGEFYGGAEAIIDHLQNPNSNVDNLVPKLIEFGEKAGIQILQFGVEDVKDWIIDTIRQNNLAGIVFFWDEFTSYITTHAERLDVLQDLTELQDIVPFYFVLAVHTAAGLKDKNFKKVQNRFQMNYITLPDNIAYELIGASLKPKPVAEKSWNDGVRPYLAGETEESRNAVAKQAKMDDKTTLEHILPIHPMAALCLKYISVYFDSNARSMFTFIKDDPDTKAYQWFIENHGPDAITHKNELLAVYDLWEYCFVKSRDEKGLTNLDPKIVNALEIYDLHKKELNDDEERVLKTILILQAINQKTGAAVDICKPTPHNLQLAFEGTDLAYNCVHIADNILVNQKEILYKRKIGNDEIYIAAEAGNKAEFEQIAKRIANDISTANLIAGVDFESIISYTPAQKKRYAISLATCNNFMNIAKKLTEDQSGGNFHIQGICLIARDDEEQHKLQIGLEKLLQDTRYNDLVFIDATSYTMGRDRFNQWTSCMAEAEVYSKNNQFELAKRKEVQAQEYVIDWKNDFSNGKRFILYPNVKQENGIQRYNIACSQTELTQEMANIVSRKYPLSIDQYEMPENLFKSPPVNPYAKMGIQKALGQSLNQRTVDKIFGDTFNLHDGKYWEVYPAHLVSKLKIKLDQYIQEQIQNERRVSLFDIVDFLTNEGFMPCNIYAYLTGFLMREYAEDPYRYNVGDSGNEGGKLDADTLGKFITEAYKHSATQDKKIKEKYLLTVSGNQYAFITCAQKVFHLTEDQSQSIEQTVRTMRTKMKKLSCPLWCYKTNADEKLHYYIDQFAKIASLPDNAPNLPQLAEEFGEHIRQDTAEVTTTQLKELLTQDKGKEAVTQYLQTYKGGQFFTLAEQIGGVNPVPDVMNCTGGKDGNGYWLWNQDTAEEEIDKLFIDYQIMAISKNEIGLTLNDWVTCMDAWRNTAEACKIPYKQLCNDKPDWKPFFTILREIVKKGDLSTESRAQFLNILTQRTQEIHDMCMNWESVFEDIYADKYEDWTHKQMIKVYAQLPKTSFATLDIVSYTNQLNEAKTKVQEAEDNAKLKAQWKNFTESNDPKTWSDQHRTPILALVPDDEFEQAKNTFDTLMSKTPSKAQIQDAMQYLNGQPSFLDDLHQNDRIEQAFRQKLLNKYAKLLPDNDEVRQDLENQFPTKSHYDWFGDPQVAQRIQKMANDHYFENGYQAAYEKFETMPGDKVKEYVMSLIRNNPDVGIAILNEGEDM